MKKIISIFLVAVMLLLISIVPANAQKELDTEYLYQDIFVERYVGDRDINWHYEEVYYHNTINEEIDWCLIKGVVSQKAATMICFLKFEDFILKSPSLTPPFDMKYAVYDVKEDVFVDLVDDYEKLSEYDGLIDVLRSLDEGMVIGDTDYDKKITVLDATNIQMGLAKTIYLGGGYTDRRGVNGNFYDFDGDGTLSILDATAIQMYLAKVE